MTAIAGKQLTDDVRRNLGFIVKMERDCNPDAVSTIAQALKADGAVASVDFLRPTTYCSRRAPISVRILPICLTATLTRRSSM